MDMYKNFPTEAQKIMDERFGHDNLIALATVDGTSPFVRTVNAYYENGSFYVITYAKSNKMEHIKKNPAISICGDWFTAQGIGENLGHVLLSENAEIMSKLRAVFAEWYDNGHTNEADENTVLLRLKLTNGILFSHGTRYDIEF